MAEEVPAGTWVEIHRVLLEPGERSDRVPPETRAVPLECRVKGTLVAPAPVGADAEIRTVTGRRLTGTLVTESPAYTHGFGPPAPELLAIGPELRDLLDHREERDP